MPELSKTTQVAMALAMPASVIIAYWLYTRWSSDEDCYGKQKVVTSHNTRIKVLVPNKVVGTIIGKQGATIKRIQSETGARLNFDDQPQDKDGKPRTLSISGTPELAQKAELMVYQIIADMPEILIEEIQVPNFCVGRIIGKGGATVRDLRRASGVKIDVDKNQTGEGPDGMKSIRLTGSRQQIDLAIEFIEEIVKNEEIEREAKHPQRSSHETFVPRAKGSIKATTIPVEEDDHWDGEGVVAEAVNGTQSSTLSTDDYIQVMVSAVEHPGHFWVQMVGPKSLHLEEMQTDITQQLESEDVREQLAVTDPHPGDMVAAKFVEGDPLFYRAQVLGVTPEGKADLYFVDFGDDTIADMDQVFKLRSEFCHYPHQAIQCQLANVEPLDETLGWTDADITLFEDLVYCAEWKPLFAKTLTYTRVQGQLGQGDGQEILRPCLQLFDTTGEKDVDVGEELVRRGHARRNSKHTSQTISYPS